MGLGDTLRKGIMDATGASNITNALGGDPAPAKDPGNFPPRPRSTVGTTSGMDAAMQVHADEQHPVAKRKPVLGADWDK